MTTDRKTMDAVLKRTFVPVLRQLGFKGSYPDFFRETGGFVALVNVQFLSAGGSFCVNLGFADAARKNVYSRPETPPDKLRLSQTRVRERLGAPEGKDHWFVFGHAGAMSFGGSILPAEKIALDCATLLVSQAEPWWERMRTVQ